MLLLLLLLLLAMTSRNTQPNASEALRHLTTGPSSVRLNSLPIEANRQWRLELIFFRISRNYLLQTHTHSGDLVYRLLHEPAITRPRGSYHLVYWQRRLQIMADNNNNNKNIAWPTHHDGSRGIDILFCCCRPRQTHCSGSSVGHDASFP